MVHPKRHLAKAITWRVIASLITAIVAWWITDSFEIGAAIFSIDAAIKIVLYYIHERIWYRVRWGVK